MSEALRVAREGTKAFNAHDEAALRASYADDAIFTGPDVELHGADATTAYAMAWLNAFPDARLTVHHEFGTDEWATLLFTFEGTHEATLSGPGGDVPATGKRLKGRGSQTIRVRDGKVAEEHLYFDQVQVLTQLGLMPEPAATTA